MKQQETIPLSEMLKLEEILSETLIEKEKEALNKAMAQGKVCPQCETKGMKYVAVVVDRQKEEALEKVLECPRCGFRTIIRI